MLAGGGSPTGGGGKPSVQRLCLGLHPLHLEPQTLHQCARSAAGQHATQPQSHEARCRASYTRGSETWFIRHEPGRSRLDSILAEKGRLGCVPRHDGPACASREHPLPAPPAAAVRILMYLNRVACVGLTKRRPAPG
eukprot:354776-Chlamydomonas_euryale.AAC.2